MKWLYMLFFTYIFLYSTYSMAQHRAVYIGTKGSFGVSVPDPNATLDENGQVHRLRTHASYAGGMLVQYVLGDKIGIESGIINTYTSYSRKDFPGSSLQQWLGWDSNISIYSNQIPIQLLYAIRPHASPNMRIKLTAGIALDWLFADFLLSEKNPLLVSSMLLGARIKSRTGKYGHIEYGFEYIYSLNGAYAFAVQTYQDTYIVHTNYSILSFNLYYFFFNRER